MNAPDLGVIAPSNAGLVVSDRIAELEAELNRMIAARNRDHQQALANGAAAAAERERREAAENLLLCYESQDFGAIAKHFARYEKEPTLDY